MTYRVLDWDASFARFEARSRPYQLHSLLITLWRVPTAAVSHRQVVAYSRSPCGQSLPQLRADTCSPPRPPRGQPLRSCVLLCGTAAGGMLHTHVKDVSKGSVRLDTPLPRVLSF